MKLNIIISSLTVLNLNGVGFLLLLLRALPTGQGDSSVILGHRVQHSVLLGDLSGGVGDDGVGEVGQPVVALDVIDPAVVVLHRVAAEGDHLDAPIISISLLQLILLSRLTPLLANSPAKLWARPSSVVQTGV